MPWVVGTTALALLTLAGGFPSSAQRTAPAALGVATGHAAAGAPITDPCKLLTQDEASAAMGAKVRPGQLTHPGPGPRCRFLTPSFAELYIDVSTPTLFNAYVQMGATPVAGIGDKAYWNHDQFGSWLHIAKGGNLVTLGLPTTIASMTPAVEHAGKLIASRM